MNKQVLVIIGLVLTFTIYNQIELRNVYADHEQKLREIGVGYNDYDGDGITCAMTDARADYMISLIQSSEDLLSSGDEMLNKYLDIPSPDRSSSDYSTYKIYHPDITDEYVQKLRECEEFEKYLLQNPDARQQFNDLVQDRMESMLD